MTEGLETVNWESAVGRSSDGGFLIPVPRGKFQRRDVVNVHYLCVLSQEPVADAATAATVVAVEQGTVVQADSVQGAFDGLSLVAAHADDAEHER
jgi:hypothetical protein